MYAAHLYILRALLISHELGPRCGPAPGGSTPPPSEPDRRDAERHEPAVSTALRPRTVSRPARAPT